MSRIYDALKLAEGVQAASLAQLIDETHVHTSTLPDAPVPFDFDESTVAGSEDQVLDSYTQPIEEPTYRSVAIKTLTGLPLLPFEGTDPKAAEQYRILRTNIVQHALRPRVISVASATAGDGKTITAINLAGSLALKGDATVLLIDADLRQRAVAKALGLDTSPGLTNVIAGSCTLEAATVQVTQYPGLYVLGAGDESGNPAEVLDSPHFRSLVGELRKRFTYVVFDTTPMAAVTDFRLVQDVSDGILIVVRPDHTSRTSLLAASQVQQRDRVLGTVINAVEDWPLWRSVDHNQFYSKESGVIQKPPSRARMWLKSLLRRS